MKEKSKIQYETSLKLNYESKHIFIYKKNAHVVC